MTARSCQPSLQLGHGSLWQILPQLQQLLLLCRTAAVSAPETTRDSLGLCCAADTCTSLTLTSLRLCRHRQQLQAFKDAGPCSLQDAMGRLMCTTCGCLPPDGVVQQQTEPVLLAQVAHVTPGWRCVLQCSAHD